MTTTEKKRPMKVMMKRRDGRGIALRIGSMFPSRSVPGAYNIVTDVPVLLDSSQYYIDVYPSDSRQDAEGPEEPGQGGAGGGDDTDQPYTFG